MAVPPGSAPLEGDLGDRWAGCLPTRNGATSCCRLVLTCRRRWPRGCGRRPGGSGWTVASCSTLSRCRAFCGRPVEVDGRRFSADSVFRELLHDQYLRFTGDEREERREQTDSWVGDPGATSLSELGCSPLHASTVAAVVGETRGMLKLLVAQGPAQRSRLSSAPAQRSRQPPGGVGRGGAGRHSPDQGRARSTRRRRCP